jgi:hypothetical protein
MRMNTLLQRVESAKQRRALYELKDRLEKKEAQAAQGKEKNPKK